MFRAAFFPLLALIGCEQPNETVASYGGGDHIWQLVSINDAPFTARATMVLDPSGAVSGHAPCNSYTARQSVPYPWFKLEKITATKTACPDLNQETAFFSNLKRMTLSEVSGPTLVLSNDAGDTMLFQPAN